MADAFVNVARRLAIEAGRRLMELRLEPITQSRKADHSVVTNADHEADQIILQGLREAFPQHAILTEESGFLGDRSAEYVWLVDPMDGTKAFVRGTEGFSVMIGLLRQGKPYAGVVMDPWQDRVYEAVQGQGAFHTYQGQRERLQVSQRVDWAEMPIVTSTGFPEPQAKKIKAQFPSPWIPAVNSVGLKVAFLARQIADLYVNHHHVHYWDTAAPEIILQEAGGQITFLDGKSLVYNLQSDFRHKAPTIATNGLRHDEFVRIIQTIL